MTQGQWVALIGGPVLVLWGIGFIVFRRQISQTARAQRERQHERHPNWAPAVGRYTQRPWMMAVAGALCCAIGVNFVIGALVGYFR